MDFNGAPMHICGVFDSIFQNAYNFCGWRCSNEKSQDYSDAESIVSRFV